MKMSNLVASPPLRAAVLAACLLMPVAGRAYWDPSPSVNVPICLASGVKEDAFVVSDGAGGAVVVWEDKRAGNFDVYAQRIDVNGATVWANDGIAVCAAGGDQHLYRSATGTTGFTPVVSDDAGGVWIAWQDARYYGSHANDVYLQRIDADGNPRFAGNGLAVAEGARTEDQPTLCADGAGGVFCVWQDKNDDPIFCNLYGQRIDGAGNRLWNNGQPRGLVIVDWDQDGQTICPDGAGGAFLAWSDSRDDLDDVYAQRLDADGNGLWGTNGIPVYQEPEGEDALTIARTEDGHAVLAWVDRRTGTSDIYAQKLQASNGAKLWGASGQAVCTAGESQYRPALATDGAGGAIIAWFDYRNAPSGPPWNLDIYAQRIRSDGAVAWTANGVAVCMAPDAQRNADVWTDSDGGVFVAWEDNRAGTGREDVYAQRLNGDGQPLLEGNGRAVSTVTNNQEVPDLVAGAGGMILAWRDDRDLLFSPDIWGDRVLVGEGAVLGVNRAAVDFGEPSGPAGRTLQVSNVGTQPLAVSAIGVSLGDQGFTVAFAGSLPRTLVPGEQMDVTVSFDPGAAPPGAQFADTLRITHDAPRWATRAGAASPASVPLHSRRAPVAVPDGSVRQIGDGFVAGSPLIVRASPNPASGVTAVVFAWADPSVGNAGPGSAAVVVVFEATGRCVRVLRAAAGTEAGETRIAWDRRDESGRPVPVGVYFVSVAAGDRRGMCSVVVRR
jgi:hypothetical protein